jgi:hypothetical protein
MTDPTTALGKIQRMHRSVPGQDTYGHTQFCEYDKTPWPCLTYRILIGEQ